MIAAYAERVGGDDPLDGLVVGERPQPEPPPGWEVVRVRAASLNHHDLWTLRGVVGPRFEPPVILGCDGAGTAADGRAVVIWPVIGEGADFHMLSEGPDGTFAPLVAVPSANLVDKPRSLSWEEAACLPTAWLTAWRMLVTKGRVRAGQHVLVQGATGGVASAAIVLARALGAHVTATSRRDAGRRAAVELGAHDAIETGARMATPVDVVVETVGQATWAHSLRAVRHGGRVVVSGATTGADPPADLRRVFWRELEVLGCTMGTLDELTDLCRFVEHAGIHPAVSRVYEGIGEVPAALRALEAGEQVGKLVIRID